MGNLRSPRDRLGQNVDLDRVLQVACEFYSIGSLTGTSVIEVGYEDCNIIVDADQGRFLAKIFAESRSSEDINRYVSIILKAIESGVRHPALLHGSTGEVVCAYRGVSLVLMRFVDGPTFLDLGRAPDRNEQLAVVEQAAKIAGIDHRPPYRFDAWAVPNIRHTFARVRQFVEPYHLRQLQQVITLYEEVPTEKLPHCLVHGDFTKSNVIVTEDGEVFILDFSVANWYPRIQELAVIAASLMSDNSTPLAERCSLVIADYSEFHDLTDEEQLRLPTYALAAVAMEFLGSLQEKYINHNDSTETDYWLATSRAELIRALP